MVASAAAKLGVYFLALLLLLAHNASGMLGGGAGRNSGRGNTESGSGNGQKEQPENPECPEACLDEQVLDRLDAGAVQSLFELPSVRGLADDEIDEKTGRPTTSGGCCP